MCKFASYEVTYYNERRDGRIEPAGRERLVLTREAAIEMSECAIVEVLDGIRNTGIFIVNGVSRFIGPRGEVLS